MEFYIICKPEISFSSFSEKKIHEFVLLLLLCRVEEL